jgi:hypothetical protein
MTNELGAGCSETPRRRRQTSRLLLSHQQDTLNPALCMTGTPEIPGRPARLHDEVGRGRRTRSVHGSATLRDLTDRPVPNLNWMFPIARRETVGGGDHMSAPRPKIDGAASDPITRACAVPARPGRVQVRRRVDLAHDVRQCIETPAGLGASWPRRSASAQCSPLVRKRPARRLPCFCGPPRGNSLCR